ncbi:MAG: tripartite tricarboxylate transporter TctB family protein [Burkholderiales bacterium]
MKIRALRDFWAGLMFIGIGCIFYFGSKQYPMGTAVRMGPAYFPSILGGLLAVLGIIIFVKAFLYDGEAPRKTQWFPMLMILGSVLAFGIIIGPLNLGVVAATLVLVVMSAAGGYEFKWKEAIISAVVLSITVPLIFYYGLGLPFKIFPWSF